MAPMLTFYGDDFTGSTAVMEVLSFAGVETMLFMEAPGPHILKKYPDLQAIGVAGIARTKDPTWMKANLPGIFSKLKQFGAPVSHYKTCSTFDSSPDVGSIGTATELGATVFDSDWVPLVVGAPEIRRFQAFGTLFAGAGANIYRLDRHPVMSRHPVTPMGEADLGKHLAAQTELKVSIVDLAAMKAGESDSVISRGLSAGAKIIAIDVVDNETLVEAGRIICSDERTVFAVGSQGVEYALVAQWRARGMLDAHHTAPVLSAVNQIFAVSGSCALTTADQIAVAEAKGFQVLDLDASAATDQRRLATEMEFVEAECLSLLSQGHDVLVTTARGPDDPIIARVSEAITTSGATPGEVNARLGTALGQLVSNIRRKTKMRRIAMGGGDTSGYALTQLGADALSAVAPLAPGAPVCRIHNRADSTIDGLEVTLKGGQMGEPTFFLEAKGGPQT